MARYTRFFASIWAGDFTNLTGAAQRLYFLLATQPDISHAGVLPLTERRWARLAADTDADSVRAALDELAQARYVVIDDHTEELLVRTYIKWDGQFANPNGLKAIEKARSQVLSPHLADMIASTLRTITEPPHEGATGGATEPPHEGDGSPKQPAAAASSHEPRTMNPQQQPTAAPPPPGPGDTPSVHHDDHAAAAAAVLDLAVETRYRACASTIRHPSRWTTKLRADLLAEHGDGITRALEAGADPIDIAARIASATRNDVIRAQTATGAAL